MAFFDKLQEVAKTVGEKTSETMKVVGDKTSDAVEITKRKAKISQEKSAILDVKKQIGELVWNKYSEGEVFSDDLTALCDSIKEHYSVISDIEAEIEAVKEKADDVSDDDSAAEDVVDDTAASEDTTETDEKSTEE